MPASKIKKYLDGHDVKYLVVSHPPAYTARDTALSAYFSVPEIAKTVIVRMDDKIAMIVVPGCYKVDFDVLKDFMDVSKIDLVAEEELERLFPDCEIGAMPPFGNLYFLNVYIAKSLAEQDVIIFNAGNHHELIEMRYKDYERLVHPRVVNFALEIF